MAHSEPNEIGLVSGETSKGPAQQALTPEQAAEKRDEAEDRAIEVAEVIARHGGKATTTLEDGTVVEIKNARVGQIGTVLKFLKIMVKKLEIISTKEQYLKARFEAITEDPLQMIELFEVAEDHVWEVLAALTSLTEEEVKDLELDDAIKVAKIAWELNKDFFFKKVLPLALGSIRVK